METKDYQTQLLESISFSLKELVRMLRVISHPTIRVLLENTLNTYEKRLVYDLMDGEKTIANIQELTKVNVRFISEWGQEWEKLGIVETEFTSTVRGRRKKLFDLSLYGISKNEILASEK